MPVYTSNGNGELPADIKEMLANWPASGSGARAVHRHMIKAGNRLRHYVPIDQAEGLIRGSMPRRPKGREIAETLEKAYGTSASRKTGADTDRVPNHLPDVGQIEAIVAERVTAKPALRELEERSPAPIPGATDPILRALYPAGALLCVARAFDNVAVVALEHLRLSAHRNSWLVPNPMIASHAIAKDGRKRRRCLANTGPRRFIVCDIDIKPVDHHGQPTIYAPLVAKWQKYGVSLQDAAAALLMHLADYGPLVMVVYSGNVSLQGWFYCAGEDESKGSLFRDFFESAVILGCDRAGWIRCQLFRMPGATHSSTKRRQTIHYFDPSQIA